MRKDNKGISIGQAVIIGIFIIMLSVSYFVSASANFFIDSQANQKFEKETTYISQRISKKMNRYSDLLYMGRAFFIAAPGMDNDTWNTFFKNQNIFKEYDGVSTIYFLDYQDSSDPNKTKAVITHLTSSDISAASTRDLIGIDVYTGDDRTHAMDESIANRSPRGTGFITLASGAEGFLVYLPVFTSRSSAPSKLVGLSFRTNDLVDALFEDEPTTQYQLSYIADNDKTIPFYKSPDWDSNNDLTRSDTIDVAGRQWQIDYSSPYNAYQGAFMQYVPTALFIVGVVTALVNLFVMEFYRFRRSLRKIGRELS